ncbi:MAG: MBL fold metallo-hydrolase [Bacteroidales bacterium]|nr:MBL fold metallo-hydrolase [Bacteroidales bacterium]
MHNLKGGYLAWSEAGKPTSTYTVETFFTPGGLPVAITLIKHGTLALRFQGLTFHVDPVGGYGKPTDYAAEFPRADVILVTHEHGDHFDRDAIAALCGPGPAAPASGPAAALVTNARCAELLAQSAPLPCALTVVANGDRLTLPGDVFLEAVPAYNYTEGRTQFHPKGRDNGFVLTMDGLRIYIAGDTEDIPEMAALSGSIGVAFLPVNQPYTMTVEQCVHAAKVIGPRILIPYHFSSTELSALPSLLPGIDVRLRDMQ